MRCALRVLPHPHNEDLFNEDLSVRLRARDLSNRGALSCNYSPRSARNGAATKSVPALAEMSRGGPASAPAVGAAPAGGKNGGGRKEAGDSGANERFERLLSAIAGTPQALARVL